MPLNFIPALPTEPPDFFNHTNASASPFATSTSHDLNYTATFSTITEVAMESTHVPSNASISICVRVLYETMGNSRVRYWDLALLIPNVFFMLFLILRSKIATLKLRQSNRPILFTFYALVITVTTTSITRAVVSMIVDAESEFGDVIDTILWIVVKFFLVGVELCVVIFGVGFSHLDSKSSITRILFITSVISLAYSITQPDVLTLKLTGTEGLHGGLEGVLEVKFPDPHFENPYDIYSHGGMLFWAISSFLFFLCYFTVLILPLTRVKEKIQLPTKHSFYIYVATLAVLYLCQGIGSILIFKNIEGGLCATDVTSFLYFSFFAPLIYVAFLHNFFRSTKQPLLLSYASGQEDETDEVHPMPTPPFVISKEEPGVNRQTPPYHSIYDSTEFLHGSPPQITGQLAFSDNVPDDEEEEDKLAVPP